jgi:hypothetical protein
VSKFCDLPRFSVIQKKCWFLRETVYASKLSQVRYTLPKFLLIRWLIFYV